VPAKLFPRWRTDTIRQLQDGATGAGKPNLNLPSDGAIRAEGDARYCSS
jgi:hypothetical protein